MCASETLIQEKRRLTREQENDKWPWSKFHTWQSWRERYRKNQDYFDYRIRKYQKGKESGKNPRKVVEEVKRDKQITTKPVLPSQSERDAVKKEKVVSQPEERVVVADSQKEASAPENEDDPMHDLFGSYVEEEEEPEERYDCYNMPFYLPKFLNRHESRPVPPNAPQPPSPQTNKQSKSVPKNPQSNLERIPKKPKLKKLPADEEDPFETPPPTPRVPLSPKQYNAPPTLVEGPFRNTLKRVRKDDHDSSWIPKRMKKATAEGVGEGVNTLPLPVAQQPTRPPNAVASSSKINPPNQKPIVAAPKPLPAAVPPQREPAPQTAAISDGDPFASKQPTDKVKGKGKAVDAPYVIETKAPPRIDLHRQSLQKRLNPSISVASWRGSVVSARTSSTSGSSRRNHNRTSRSLRQSVSELDFSDDGKLFAFRAAQEMARKVAEMAREHGVSTEIAMKTYTKTGSMEKTKVILEHFRKTLLAAEQEIYERMPIVADKVDYDADTDEEDIPEGLIPSPLVPAPKSMHESTPPKNKRPSSTKRRNPRPSLMVKPLPPDYDEMDDLSEYSPPNDTRAGQFARLTKRGRAEEAMAREMQHVSIGAVLPTRSSTEAKGALPLTTDVSPTPHSHLPASAMVPDEQDDDDIYMQTDDEQHQSPHPNDEQPHEADDEAESPSRQTQETEDISQSPFPSISRKLIKRISGGRENDPTLLAAAREYQIYASNVNADNADEMKAFEAKNNPDLLRLWSINLVNEMIAQSKEHSGVKEETRDGDERLGVD